MTFYDKLSDPENYSLEEFLEEEDILNEIRNPKLYQKLNQ